MIALAMLGASATLPRPTMPSSVSISTTVHEWKRKVLMVSAGEYSRSMALEQKLPCGGTVLPFHWKTRARTDWIFMVMLGVERVQEGTRAFLRCAAPMRLAMRKACQVASTLALPWP